jgi:hypothetical protein
MATQSPFGGLVDSLKRGDITRRQFYTQGMALGIGLPVLMFIANSIRVEAQRA